MEVYGRLHLEGGLQSLRFSFVDSEAREMPPVLVTFELVNAIMSMQEDLALELLARPVLDDFTNGFFEKDGVKRCCSWL